MINKFPLFCHRLLIESTRGVQKGVYPYIAHQFTRHFLTFKYVDYCRGYSYQTLYTSVNSTPMFPPSLWYIIVSLSLCINCNSSCTRVNQNLNDNGETW